MPKFKTRSSSKMFSIKNTLLKILPPQPKRPSLKSLQTHLKISPSRYNLLNTLLTYDYAIFARVFLLAGTISTPIFCSTVTSRQYLVWIEELLLGSFLFLAFLINFLEERLPR
jgi:hypothetical protein